MHLYNLGKLKFINNIDEYLGLILDLWVHSLVDGLWKSGKITGNYSQLCNTCILMGLKILINNLITSCKLIKINLFELCIEIALNKLVKFNVLIKVEVDFCLLGHIFLEMIKMFIVVTPEAHINLHEICFDIDESTIHFIGIFF